MVDEMEKAGHVPALTHPAKAKLMMGQLNKTDNWMLEDWLFWP